MDTTFNTVLSSNLSATNKITRPATTIIAAFDAPDIIQDQADYVCNESDWEPDVQTLITNAAGGKVLMMGGTFLKNTVAGFSIPSNTTLELIGTIQLIPNVGNDPHILTISDVDNVKLIGGTYDGNLPNHTTLTGVGMDISLYNVTNSEISGIRAINAGVQTGAYSYAFYLNNCTNSNIHDCYAIDSGRSSYTIYNGCEGVRFANNYSINPVAHNFNVHDVTNCEIIGNVTQGGQRGVELFGTISGLSVVGNYFNAFSYNALHAQATELDLNKILFSNNSIVGTGVGATEPAIYLSEPFNNCQISNNYISNSWAGIGAYGENLTIKNNRVDGCGHGIYTSGATCVGAIIDGNVLTGQSTDSLWVNGSSGAILENNVLNDTKNVTLVNADNTLFKNNTFYRTVAATYDLTIDSDSNGVNILYNQFLDTGFVTTKIADSGTNTKIFGNDGYVTENSDTATIPASSTSIIVDHGLVSAPTKYFAFPGGNLGNCWVDTVTSTQMTIHCETAPASDTTVCWSVEV
ncbi:MAG: right-handed parallel beta-helix repeat-containing protein [Paludibacter sp.]|nr:right-handed parallel beta-helix repeat-containing protein [Paludibacter sp.]